jgi:threonine aldolase
MAQIPGITVEMPETNLVFFDTEGSGMTSDAFAGKLRQDGVLVSTSGKYRGRACLHLDVTAAQVEEALSVMKQVVNAA